MRLVLAALAVISLAACSGAGGSGSVSPPMRNGAGAAAGAAKPLPVSYTLIDLGANVEPARINAAGEVVGRALVNVNAPSGQAFYYHSGVSTLLGTAPGFSFSAAFDINNAGAIVGSSFNASGLGVATLFHLHAAPTSLGNPPGTDSSYATSVNPAGEIVGVAYNSQGQCGNANGGLQVARFDGTPAVLTGGLQPYAAASGTIAYTAYFSGSGSCNTGNLTAALYPSGGVALPANAACSEAAYSQPTDITDAGEVIGNYNTAPSAAECRTSSYQAGFLSTSTGATEIDGPGGVHGTSVNGVNDQLWVVGNTQAGAFIWANGTAVYLKDLLPASCSNWTLLQATDVNDSGAVVGIGSLNGTYHGFLLIPH